VACASCGADADLDALFCWRCGERLDGAPAVGAVPPTKLDASYPVMAASPAVSTLAPAYEALEPDVVQPTPASVRPPEALDPFAGWWPRGASLMIDLVACSVPLWIAFTIAGAAAARSPRVLHPGEGTVSDAVATALVLSWIALLLGYFTVLNGRFRGQTLGNFAVGLAVRDAGQDRTIGLLRGFFRFLLRLVLYGFFLIPGVVNDLFPLWTKRRQTLIDKIVRSVVVKR